MVTRAEYGGCSIHKLELPILNRAFGISTARVTSLAPLKIFTRGYMYELSNFTNISDLFFSYEFNKDTDIAKYIEWMGKHSNNNFWRPVKLLYENRGFYNAVLNEKPADRVYNTGLGPIIEGEAVYIYPPLAQLFKKTIPLHIFEYDLKTYMFPFVVSATEHTKILNDCYKYIQRGGAMFPQSFDFKTDFMKLMDGLGPNLRKDALDKCFVYAVNQKPVGYASTAHDSNHSGIFNTETGIIKEGVLFTVFYSWY